jgi:DNA mismatch repair protein MutS
MDSLTPMMRQYHEIKREHPELLLFFRLGDFYEMFYEDALVASRELEITLTSRNTDRKGNPIPMCGVPHHALTNYLNRLVKKGYKVAVCEQVEDPRLARGIVRREVTRIVTPGTVVDEGMLEAGENNFMASFLERDGRSAAAFLDLSTGEFWTGEFSGEEAPEQVVQAFLHFQPRELVLPESDQERLAHRLPPELRSGPVRTPRSDWTFNSDYAERLLLEHFRVATLEGFGVNGHHLAVSAAGALLGYVRQTQKSDLGHIGSLALFDQAGYLKMDEATRRNLELVQGVDGNRQWTLLSVLDLTRTAMGARLLRGWLLRPSLDLEEIENRLDAVEELQHSVVAMDRLSSRLKSIHDMERMLSRATLGTATPRDLLALRDSLQALPELRSLVAEYRSPLLGRPFDLLTDLLDQLTGGIDEDAPVMINEGRIIRAGYSAELDDLREISTSGKSFIARLEARERERSRIPSLKVRYNRVFGYFIEVTKANLASVPADYMRKQTLVNAERFITPELKEYEEKVLSAEEKIFELEKALFIALREAVAAQAERIRSTAGTVALIDVLLSFAEAAKKRKYVRPRLDSSQELLIRAGRHPVLELQGSEPFVPNDLCCNAGTEQLLILTGPNMGGKSTYLRQNALIVLMAQMGSFVPADEARVGLVDRIFTRVGASDNLARGRSTFMVEMIETANILNSATRRSFVLLDEVGRGTATFDGLSIAWSVAEYLVTEPNRRSRTLFATHYQELTKLERLYEGVRNYCVSVRQSGTEIVFFHRVMPGIASKSYGIEVARLAGLPQKVLERAREILFRLEKKEIDLAGRARSRSPEEVVDELQKRLF